MQNVQKFITIFVFIIFLKLYDVRLRFYFVFLCLRNVNFNVVILPEKKRSGKISKFSNGAVGYEHRTSRLPVQCSSTELPGIFHRFYPYVKYSYEEVLSVFWNGYL